MSQLKTNSIANVAGTASTDVLNVINGSAKAWVNFNGTGTVAIRAQYNVSSITDNGNGDYTLNFTNALADANYSANISGLGANTGNLTGSYVIKGTQGTGATLKTSTQLAVQTGSSSSAAVFDTADINVAIFR